MNAATPYRMEMERVKGSAGAPPRRPRSSWQFLNTAPLHDFPVRDEILFQYLTLSPEMDVAEAGLGTGFTGCWMAPQVRSYTGIDVSAATVDRLHQELGHLKNAEFFCADLAKPAVAQKIGKRFHVVYGIDVFEYVPNPDVCLRNLAELLLPDGMLLLSYPNVPPPRGDGVTWFERRSTLEELLSGAGFSRWEISELRLRAWPSFAFRVFHEWPISLYRSRHKAERGERPQIYEDTWAFQNGQRLGRYRAGLHAAWAGLSVMMRLTGRAYADTPVAAGDNMLGRQLLIRAWK